jgi:cation:H+ antiporter
MPLDKLIAFARFDYLTLFSKDGKHTAYSAWMSLILSVLNLIAACYILMEGVIGVAEYFHMNVFFVAVILAAAGTSVPDTVISIKSALKGDYDDAIANAVGSNIFDICVCIGLTSLIWTLMNGPIEMPVEINAAELRVILVGLTLVVIALFLQRRIGYTTAITLIAGYFLYAYYTICRGLQVEWAMSLGHNINHFLGLE